MTQRCSPSSSRTSCSAHSVVRTHSDLAVKANISPVGLFAHYEPESGAAEVQKDVPELDFSQILNGLRRGEKSQL